MSISPSSIRFWLRRLAPILILGLFAAVAAQPWIRAIGYYGPRIQSARDAARIRELRIAAVALDADVCGGEFRRTVVRPDWARSQARLPAGLPQLEEAWFAAATHLRLDQTGPRRDGPGDSPPKSASDQFRAAAEIDELESLSIASSEMRDDRVRLFARMPRLRLLDLRGTHVSEAALAVFESEFRHLRFLFLPVEIPDAALDRLRAARPGLWVESQCKNDGLRPDEFTVEVLRAGDDHPFVARCDELARLLPGPYYPYLLAGEYEFFASARARRVICRHSNLFDDRWCSRLKSSPCFESLLVRPDPHWRDDYVGGVCRELNVRRLGEFTTLRYLGVEAYPGGNVLPLRLATLTRLECLWRSSYRPIDDAEAAALRRLPALKRLIVSSRPTDPDEPNEPLRPVEVRGRLAGMEVIFADIPAGRIGARNVCTWSGPDWAAELGALAYFPMFGRHTAYRLHGNADVLPIGIFPIDRTAGDARPPKPSRHRSVTSRRGLSPGPRAPRGRPSRSSIHTQTSR